MRMVSLLAAFLILFSAGISAQNLDDAPYNPDTDPDIDLYMASWRESLPRVTHGNLVERDILTRGDALDPPRSGAVLQYVNRFARALLEGGASTRPTVLEDEQEVFYILSGSGKLKADGREWDLHRDVCFLVPAEIEFTIHADWGEPLTMYLVSEPVPAGFTPVDTITCKDAAHMRFNEVVGHWSYKEKDFVLKPDGLATIHGVATLTMDPMAIGHPHFHGPGVEEIWTTISGTNTALLGTELRMQHPGTAYMIPPDGRTNHANINESKTEPLVMLYIAVRKDIE